MLRKSLFAGLAALGLSLAAGCSAVIDTGSLKAGRDPDGGGGTADSSPQADATPRPDAARPTPGVEVLPVSGLTTTEAGGTATFQVWLENPPTATVVISVSSSDKTEGMVDKSELVFEPANYSTKQTVTVAGQDDPVADGAQTYTIMLAPTRSEDDLYNGIDPDDVEVSNSDNETPGVTVKDRALTTTEAQDDADPKFTVQLTTQPTERVVLTFTVTDPTEGKLKDALGADLTELIFMPEDWNTAQEVTLEGVDDNIDDGEQTYKITLGIASDDPDYDDRVALKLDDQTLTITNEDDDTAGIQLLGPGVPGAPISVTEDGSDKATFTVTLHTRPVDDVVLKITVSSDEGVVDGGSDQLLFDATTDRLTFDIVAGTDDQVVDGDKTFDVTLTVDRELTKDEAYKDVGPTSLQVTNADDEEAGVTIGADTLTIIEGGPTHTANISVVLDKEPAGPVVIVVSGAGPDDSPRASITDPAGPTRALTFTPIDWDQPQAVKVEALQDDDVADGAEDFEVEFAVDKDSSAVGYQDLDLTEQKVSITVEDDDMAGITVSKTELTTSEALGTDTFTVELTSAPIADVTVEITTEMPTFGELQPAATASTAELTFTSADYGAKTVTVAGLDHNMIVEVNPDYFLTFKVTSADGDYNEFVLSRITVSHEDNDT